MKKFLLLLIFISGLSTSFSQNPQIQGDLMLCPWTNGTATVMNQTYDTYQWYYKYWFTSDNYVAISGADQASFTYDWYTYDQALLKVVVTLGTDTFESNEIQIDSYAWSSLIIVNEINETVSVDNFNGNFLLCQGGSFNNTINSPYNTNIQWYKDGLPIPGATTISYVITEPGNYYVEASPDFCPNSSSNNQGMSMVVEWDTNCTLSTNSPTALNNAITIYPNPVAHTLTLGITKNSIINSYSIIDASGKVLIQQKVLLSNNATIDVSNLSNGFYILKLESDSGEAIKKFIKE
ncbi:T9SS type A sorting domain-containing protein [Flavobacterium jejuense]|uniref:T9SS type A sorting domain-containing protein n=1 Tax=Flavobacterium jejuense TaxID=1544455 RepID=A0ABX0IR14_9FLAO|nr:T9SS type A sorting domain-containing protein [Flavobacterium jejuense]NHN24566.1 T9SS type A sorting domain-containing protein [Flavobacterium jejuense]